ncbi:DnaJ homolog subfamily C member 2 [Entomortierella parvispora]|uniref:DnaJ homolog subfamily C member 2 n=1 Tax=Entomortierella parvispora TaxID=205924 RepID=A0A9P3LSY2_9FUNG|nr:DnaJ homolog subfamily C member 2 [Entomortierella parvispora]
MGNSSSASKDSADPMTLDSLCLGKAPADWDYSQDSKQHHDITAPVMERIEPVGPQFLAHARRQLFKRSFSEDEAHQAKSEAEAAAAAQLAEDAENSDFEIEPDHKDDLRRDAKEWKTQDHYRMLGLGTIRWRATRGMIKKAHRTKVLVHHPDKKSAASGGNSSHDDGFFKCLQKAYEILSDDVKRKQYDSVDPIPEESYSALKDGADLPFTEAWAPVFERESRFSSTDRAKIPKIGTMKSTKAEVEAFYGFWYDFDSWRTFEYLDKEEGDAAENRDDKRYLEKKNKAERAKLKKEDMARLRKLVDTAFALDPRMAAFKEQEKELKEAKKRERQEQANKLKQDADREAALAKELEEERESEERLKKEEERKEKEAKKKTVRKEKKNIKTLVKDANYGYAKGAHISPSSLEIYLSELETMLDKLTLEDLEKISKDLGTAKTSNEDKQKVLSAFAQRLVRDGLATTENLSQFGTETVERVVKKTADTPTATTLSPSSPSTAGSSNTPTKEWSVEEVALLIKAANKFPGGVSNRWDTIAAYVALHTGLPQRDADDVIKKSKAVQKGSSQEATVRQLQFQKKTYDIADAPSVRYDIEGEVPPVVSASDDTKASTAQAIAAAAAVGAGSKTKPKKKAPTAADVPAAAKPIAPTPPTAATPPTSGKTAALAAVSSPVAAAAPPAASLWTTAEQKSLEAGLKSFPPSWQGEGDRWDKIAEAVPGRTKKECKLRVKFLQDQAKAQKAAAGK